MTDNKDKMNLSNKEDIMKLKFEALTPIDTVENMQAYEQALDFAIKEQGICNIAITGPYGSGKTSVLHTYRRSLENNNKENEKRNFMFISLADFKDEKGNLKNDVISNGNTNQNQNKRDNSQNLEHKIEGKILNQIIHQVDPKSIQKTNFKVIQEGQKINFWRPALYFLSILVIFIYLMNFGRFESFLNLFYFDRLKNIFEIGHASEVYMIMLAIILLLLAFGGYKLIEQHNLKPFLKKIKVDSYEIELFDENKQVSPFDEYLDEILYIFLKAEHDIFVFEDIDRYEVHDIFIRLREINVLLNKKSKMFEGDKKEIKFIYLLRDDVFTSTDRTKFFDFVIPIVPVMDSSNSYDKLFKILERSGRKQDFSSVFLKQISHYIDDFRLLKNIYNEYLLYYEAIKETKIDKEKLFALMTYKNIFPKDFNDLQYGKGYVYEVIQRRNSLIEQRIESIDEQVDENKKKITEIEKESIKNVIELIALYVDTNFNDRTVKGYRSNYKTQISYIRDFMQQEDAFKKVSSYIKDMEEFSKRKHNIELWKEDYHNRLRSDNAELLEQRNEFNNLSVAELLDDENEYHLFEIDINGVSESHYFNLIKHLIRSGHIDENYQNYLTYFWEGSTTVSDRVFINSVLNNEPLSYDYKLEQNKEILLHFSVDMYKRPAILNYNLLDYLIKKKNQESVRLLINNVKKTSSFDFVVDFMEQTNNQDLFGKYLFENWTYFLSSFIEVQKYSEEIKINYIFHYFKLFEEDTIKANSENNVLVSYLSEVKSVPVIESTEKEKIISSLNLLNIRFRNLDLSNMNHLMAELVIEHGLFEVNENMIIRILKWYGCNKDDIETKNYTLISNMDDNHVFKQLIEAQQSKYLKVYINHITESIIADDEEVALKVLNSDISFEDKDLYVSKYSILLTEITKIKSFPWKDIIKHKKILLTIENIISYFIEINLTIDDILTEFINAGDLPEFNMSVVENRIDKNVLNKFIDRIMSVNEINNDTYSMLIKHAEVVDEVEKVSNLDEDKLILLLNENLLLMHEDILKYLRNKFNDLILRYIERDSKAYLDILEENPSLRNDGELKVILREQSIDVEELKILFDMLEDKDSEDLLMYPTGLQVYIIKKHPYCIDIHFILDHYYAFEISMQEEIVKYYMESYHDLTNFEIDMPKEILFKVIKSEDFNKDEKIGIITPFIKLFNRDETITYLEYLGIHELIAVIQKENQWKQIKTSDIPFEFLKLYENENWILRARRPKGNPEYIRVYAS